MGRGSRPAAVAASRREDAKIESEGAENHMRFAADNTPSNPRIQHAPCFNPSSHHPVIPTFCLSRPHFSWRLQAATAAGREIQISAGDMNFPEEPNFRGKRLLRTSNTRHPGGMRGR